MKSLFLRSSLVVASAFFAACGAADSSNLNIIPETAMIDDDKVTRFASVSDAEFCQAHKPEECFTFIVSVPSPELESQLGLNTLALSSQSESFQAPWLKSCHKGLQAYIKGQRRGNTSKRNRLFGPIKESRCAFDYVRREIFETPDLPQGQLGFAARLSAWDIKGKTSTKKLGATSVTIYNARLNVSYRNAMVFAKPVGENHSRWSDLRDGGFWRPFGPMKPLGTQNFSLNFNDDIKVQFSAIEGIERLNSALANLSTEAGQDAVGNFVREAARLSGEYLAGSKLDSSIALLGIGIDAVRAICKEDCTKFDTQTVNSVKAMSEALGDKAVVDSYSKSIFADSHGVMPGKLIDDAFWHADPNELEEALGWEHGPHVYDPFEDGIY